MANRLLYTGTGAPYGALQEQLVEGETLAATWLRDPAMAPHARPVKDSTDYNSIVAKTKAGYYVELQFFASTQPSENYQDYHGVSPDLEWMKSVRSARHKDS